MINEEWHTYWGAALAGETREQGIDTSLRRGFQFVISRNIDTTRMRAMVTTDNGTQYCDALNFTDMEETMFLRYCVSITVRIA